MNFRKNTDLWIIGILAVLEIILTISGILTQAFAVLGIMLVLVFPGYVWSEVILAKVSYKERILIIPALSIVIVGLSGLILNLTPWGLRAGTWGIWLGIVTLGGLPILWKRRVIPEAVPESGWPDANWRQVGLYGAAAVIFLGAFGIAQYSSTRLNRPLSMLWATNDPTNPKLVNIGIQNNEGRAITYHLVAQTNGKVIREWAGIHLEDGKTYSVQLTSANPFKQPVEIFLYRSDLGNRAIRAVQVAPILQGNLSVFNK
jgi:uncharacterized membrane protein